MLDFLIDNIFVEFGGFVFQQTIVIPMGTNCTPLLADLFLYSYETEACTERRKEISPVFRYIDDVLSLNNNRFSDH